jgi:hypothetical protein
MGDAGYTNPRLTGALSDVPSGGLALDGRICGQNNFRYWLISEPLLQGIQANFLRPDSIDGG